MLIVTAAATTVMTAYCCTNMPLTPLWELLNTLQIMVHIPIFSLQIPGLVFIVYDIIIQIVKFEFYETQDTASIWFALDPEEGPYSDEFERLDFKRKTVIAGSGFFIPILILGIFPVLLSICLYPPSKIYQNIASLRTKIDKMFRWNYTLRSLFETTLDIAMLGMIETYV